MPPGPSITWCHRAPFNSGIHRASVIRLAPETSASSWDRSRHPASTQSFAPCQRSVRIFGLHVGRIAIADFADHDKAALRQHGRRRPQIAAAASHPSRPGNRMSPAWATGCFSVRVPRKVRVHSTTFACKLAMRHLPCQNWYERHRRPAYSESHGTRTRMYGPAPDDGTARNRTARNA